MTAVGLVGGLGPESTVDYYMRIIRGWQAETPDTSPAVVIDSLDVRHALKLVAGDRPGLAGYLLGSVKRLAAAGVDFVAMTANTPHIVFDELAAASRLPMVSIVETCAKEAEARGLKRPLLLGTRFTMEATFYPEVFKRRGIEICTPGAEDREWLHHCYVEELLRGKFLDATRVRVLGLIERRRDLSAIDAVILGGTELPLLMPGDEIGGLPALDTTALHVAEIIRRLRA